MGKEETINLYDALRWMEEQKQPFRVEFITTSLSRRTGGKVRVINRALVGPLKDNVNKEFMIGFKDLDQPDEKILHTYIYSITFVNGKKVVI
jgi:hypothetical protein